MIGLQWGIVGVAACYAISSTFLEPLNALITSRVLGRPFREFAMSFSGVFQAAVLTAGIVLAAKTLLVAQGVPSAPRLAILVAVGLGAYVPISKWRAPEVVRELRSVVRRARPVDTIGAA